MRDPKKARWFVPAACAVLFAALAASACSGDKADAKGQIVLAMQTDMSIPDDVSAIRIIVLKNGALKFDQKYEVGPDKEKIPATLGLVASDDPEDTVEVRVLAYQRAVVRTLNRVVTTIPPTRIATLNVPIQWLCWNQVVATEGVSDSYDSSCEDVNQACIAGECRDVEFDSTTLPDFDFAAIHGGADEPELGRCLDTVPCFDAGHDIGIREGCTIGVSTAEAARLNVALTLPPGRGICSAGTGLCYIPLDQDDIYGWRQIAGAPPPLEEGGGGAGPDGAAGQAGADAGGPGAAGDGAGGAGSGAPGPAEVTIQLPTAVCARLADGTATGVRVTSACEVKTSTHPTCGPWTDVGTENETNGPVPGGTGMNPMPPVDTMCPELYTAGPSTPIAGDPEIDRFAHLALEISKQTNRIRSDVGAACSSINDRIGGAPSTYAGVIPTDAELQAACTDAANNIGDTQSYQLYFSPGHCRANVDVQLAGEADCPAIPGCTFGDFNERCSSAFSTCDGGCFGQCLPTGMPIEVTCNGGCAGQCVGTCDGTCTGPTGNTLPSSNCMGACAGVCSGTCQGECTTDGPCDGDCVGSCTDTSAPQGCETPLEVPACAQMATCQNMAAADAGVRQSCTPPFVFVSAQTPPNVAPAISENYPRLLHAIQENANLYFAYASLSYAGIQFSSAGASADAACAQEAYTLLAQSAASLSISSTEASNVLIGIDSGVPPVGGACVTTVRDDACIACGKTQCCPEATACAASPNCQSETTCLESCAQTGSDRMLCEGICLPQSGMFDAATVDFADCFFPRCTPCGASVPACALYGANLAIDDFEDADFASTWGTWRLTGPVDGDLQWVSPGANASVHALGVFGGPDPGISLDFTTCANASNATGLSFDAFSDTSGTVMTVRVHTIGTERQPLGNCAGAACGDYFQTTVVLDPAFANYALPWTNFRNSARSTLLPNDILGIDFVLLGGAGTFGIDNVWFGASAGPP